MKTIVLGNEYLGILWVLGATPEVQSKRFWKRIAMNSLPLNFRHNQAYVNPSIYIWQNLLHKLPSPAAPLKGPDEQIATLQDKVKRNECLTLPFWV